MKKVVIYLTQLLFAILVQSCDNTEYLPQDTSIEGWIRGQNLPKQQPYKTVLQNPFIYIFRVQYGEPSDCPSGCFYASAVGIKFNNDIGWLQSYDTANIKRWFFYDVRPSDNYLFSQTFWEDLLNTDQWIYYNALLPVLVKDNDTPIEALERITKGLYTYIYSYLGELLLLNSKANSDKDILTLLANLPVSQGDAYSAVREKAKQRLIDLDDP